MEIHKIIDKVKELEKTIDDYDTATLLAAEATNLLAKTNSETDEKKVEQLEQEYEESVKELEEMGSKCFNLQDEIVISIATEVENKKLRGSLVALMLSRPDFAGLDQKAMEELGQNKPATESITYVHQIFIEHSKMVARKTIQALEPLL